MTTPRVVIIGGCGHVGLPLGIALASRGADVVLQDLSETATAMVAAGRLPFQEEGAQPLLDQALADGRLSTTTDPRAVADADVVVVVIGTPVDEHLNPDPAALPRVLAACTPHLRDGQLIVLRSTVYPGVTAGVERMLAERGLAVDVAFCPERIAEGKAMTELFALPQIISARDDRVMARAEELFALLTESTVRLRPEEAELAKLFTNAWRYLKFAAVNQFYMIADGKGLDFARIQEAVVRDYPRAADMPGPGFAAGPCLFKDTMQLAAFNDNNFQLGHAAMLVNEGLPLHVIREQNQVRTRAIDTWQWRLLNKRPGAPPAFLLDPQVPAPGQSRPLRADRRDPRACAGPGRPRTAGSSAGRAAGTRRR